MKDNTIERSIQIEISGRGDSLWGDSKGTWIVTRMVLRNLGNDPYELCLYGGGTHWTHYTDTRIEKEVNKKLLSTVQSLYPDHKITGIYWSEQGMQPTNGWSFDIISNATFDEDE